MKNLSIVVGNGLSIAANSDLNLQSITSAVVARIEGESTGGSDVVASMKKLAAHALPDGEAASDDDFEILIGALGAESRSLGYLRDLAEVGAPDDSELAAAIGRVADFANQVRDAGVSHTLEVIYERSRHDAVDTASVRELISCIEEEFDGTVTFGNLNYDTVLLTALLDVCSKADLADLGAGFGSVDVDLGGDVDATGMPLRDVAQFPDRRRLRLLHLHGSLTFWAEPGGKQVKVTTRHLDESNPWEAIRTRATDWRPVVVLASSKDKPDHVRQRPFCTAYEGLRTSLEESDHWLIVGYSFRDASVNTMLREVFLDRLQKPKVLVVTHGDALRQDDIARAFGWGVEDRAPAWLQVERDGVARLTSRQAWTTFSD